MTELLDPFEIYDEDPEPAACRDSGAVEALRAVLDIHRPWSNMGKVYCDCCQPAVYPCATVKAIVEKLKAPIRHCSIFDYECESCT